MRFRSVTSFSGRILGIATVAYVLFIAFVYFAQEKLIFFPEGMSGERWQQVAEDVGGELLTITATDGIRLRGWLLTGNGTAPRPTVLFFGGNAMRLDRFAYELDTLRSQNVNVVLVDYRGYGYSEGTPSADAMRRDSESIYDAMRTHEAVDPSRVYLWGVSIGSGAATHLASVREVAGVVLFAPYTSMVEVGRETYPYLPVGLLLRHRLDNLALAPHLQAPALIVHGAADHIHGVDHAEKLAAAWGGDHKLIILEDRGHNDLLGDKRAWREVVEFLRG